jgi:hypothetical protein
VARASNAPARTEPADTDDESAAVPKKAGQVEYLFPQDEPAVPTLAKVEPDDDMGIPAFMRRRRNRT